MGVWEREGTGRLYVDWEELKLMPDDGGYFDLLNMFCEAAGITTSQACGHGADAKVRYRFHVRIEAEVIEGL
jgi:hypothetical protein